MKRNDGKKKQKAKRNYPEFEWGFRDNPAMSSKLHPRCKGVLTKNHHKVISLFAGCGGMDLGFCGGFRYLNSEYPVLPFDIIEAIDNSPDAIETYNLNLGHHARLGDLQEIDVNSLAAADILLGGFPCQDFSSSGPKLGLNGKRGKLYRVMVDYMETHRPAVVVGENVPHLARLNGGQYLDIIIRELEEVGYKFEVWELYAPDYGLSQSRRRLFLVGVRNDLSGKPIKPVPTHSGRHLPIDFALADLEMVNDESIANQSQYFISSKATSGGGQGDHANKVGSVAYCIRANARGRIQFHYNLNRRLTVRECARLQSFPNEFVFPYTTQRNLTLIGNAVPPILAHAVAKSISDFMNSMRTVEKLQIDRINRLSRSIPAEMQL